MKGSVLISILLIITGAMGIGLWYTIEKAYYVNIIDVNEINVAGTLRDVKDYNGIDAETSPLKLRACFNVDWEYNLNSDYKNIATPLIAPKAFNCFDAKKIGADIQAENASVILADVNVPFGFDKYIVQYPNGKSYMWRQINECGKAHFAGDPLPLGCPVPKDAILKNIMRDPNSVLHEIKLTEKNNNQPTKILIDSKPVSAFSTDAKFYNSCFNVASNMDQLLSTYVQSKNPMPSKPLGKMSCFNFDQLEQDIKTGVATSFIGEENIIDGIDRIVAIYSDGRALAWHQRAK